MKHKNNTIDFIEFPARNSLDIALAKGFYSSVFGWAFQDWGDDYIDTQNSGVGSGFNADAAHQSVQPLTVIYSTNLETARARAVASGGKITREVFSFPGGRRFHFADPIGNELAVWSDQSE